MAFQSLYRRYRPQRFEQLRGQDHVVRTLRNAVRDQTVSHAYLFSGPRGTGKTSTARILAKALNCEDPADGEPCDRCGPCRAVEAGTSLDVNELDAASNNGIEAMRDLISRVALASAGGTKLYILDEVHMLSAAASNALLKTLEEPPGHVVFVLATTDPQKVLPTLRSRTQHLDFHLLPATTLHDHLRWVAGDAGLEVDEPALALAVRRGRGSARDALSALDQIVAAGGTAADEGWVAEAVDALCERDTGRALAAVAGACGAGRDPRHLADALLAHLRDAFLSVMAPDVVSLPDVARDQVADHGRRLGPPATVQALDAVGEAVLAMREAPDPRIALEVALVRVTRPEIDTSPAALVERIERLEQAVRRGGAPGAVPDGAALAGPSSPSTGRAAARQAVATVTAPVAEPPPPPFLRPEVTATVTSGRRLAGEAGPGGLPSRDELTLAWADHVLPRLRPVARGLFGSGRFVRVSDGAAELALPTDALRTKCEARRAEVESVLAANFGGPVPLRLVVDASTASQLADGGAPASAAGAVGAAEDEVLDPAELVDAPAGQPSGIDHLTAAFPGAELVDEQPR